MPRYLLPFLILILAVLLAVIIVAGSVSQPTVAIEGVRPVTLTPASTTLEVDVRITNPNPFEIPVKETQFTVSAVEGSALRTLGTGNMGPFMLPAGQSSRLNVPVTLDNRALLDAALAAVKAGQDQMTFRVAGTVTGDLYGITTVDVPFEQDRTVTLQEVVGATGVRVDEAAVRKALGQAGPIVRDLAERLIEP